MNRVWRACKLPHCVIDSGVAFWHDYIGPAWMHRSKKAFFHFTSSVVGLHFSRPWLLQRGSGRVCLGTGDFLWPQGAIHPGFYPFRRNADGAKGTFGNAGCMWLRPCDRTHFKKGLVPYLFGGGMENKYRKRFESWRFMTRDKLVCRTGGEDWWGRKRNIFSAETQLPIFYKRNSFNVFFSFCCWGGIPSTPLFFQY